MFIVKVTICKGGLIYLMGQLNLAEVLSKGAMYTDVWHWVLVEGFCAWGAFTGRSQK